MHLRWKHRLGPIPIAAKLDTPASTEHAVPIRCRLNRLSHVDRITGEPAPRYERARPGELIHVHDPLDKERALLLFLRPTHAIVKVRAPLSL